MSCVGVRPGVNLEYYGGHVHLTHLYYGCVYSSDSVSLLLSDYFGSSYTPSHRCSILRSGDLFETVNK